MGDFTPGPWAVCADNASSAFGHSVVAGEGLIAERLDRDDARLIAAAPELLDALKRVMASEHSNAGGGRECCCVAHENARAAIAKAEGKAS